MTKKLALVLAATGALAVQAAPYQAKAKSYLEHQAANPMRYARHLKSASVMDIMALNEPKGKKISPSKQLPQADLYSFLDGPKGELWACTYDFETETIQHDYYVETKLHGVTVTVFDSNLEEVGKVVDHFDPAEGQSGIAQIMIDPVLTQRFFNFDQAYELAVMVSYNTPEYINQNKTYIYSVGADLDADGHTPRLAEFDGYIVSSVDAGTDKWSEDFYITFVTESGYDDNATTFEEYVASQKYIAETYKKAGWGGGPEPIGKVEISVANLPGDMMSCPFMLSSLVNGQPTFIVQQYEKWFFNNAIGPIGDHMEDDEEGMPTENNNLIVDVYTYPRMGSDWILDHTTKVPCVQEDDIADVVFRYYGIGNLTYEQDYRPDGSLRMSIYKYRLSDDDNYLETYVLYDKDGQEIATLAENASSYILMSEVPGQEDQAMFIDLNSITDENPDATASFYFVNLESGERVLEISNVVDRFTLRANVDRVPFGNTYRYAFETNQTDVDDDFNVWENILWLDADGQVVRVDKINLGPSVALAKVYLDQSVLNPYLFDTDDAQEYLWLVKRYINLTGSETVTELVIGSANGNTLLILGPDESKGRLNTISTLKTDTQNPLLWVSYVNDNDLYNQDFYELPFNTLKGSGTEADPYKLATIGDFLHIGKNLNAYYVLTDDIDASVVIFNTISGTFTGKLDGAGHSINNLAIAGNGSIFSSLTQGAEIKNLYINNVKILSNGTTTGTLASTASEAKIDNVHILGLTASLEGTVTFGGLLGGAYLHSTISDCSVSAANINAPNSSDLGGVCGDMRTGATISSASFAGSIHAGSYVGGIAGSMNSDNTISDCHVDADIVALNTVGGIAGYQNTGLITRCYVEGSVEAVGNPAASYDFGPAAGGILGYLNCEGSVLSSSNVEAVLKDNMVALSSLKGYTPKTQDNTTATLHRIAGRTIFNQEADETTGSWAADPRLSNNFALASIPVNDNIEATENSTEGKSVEVSALNQDWFKNSLGFQYGDTAPWNDSTDADPALNHEQLNVCVPAKVTAPENTKFVINVILAGREIYTEETAMEQFSYDCDEQYLAPTGVFSLVNNVLGVEFEAYKQGEVPVTICGAKCLVTITENLGVSDNVIEESKSVLTFSGTNVQAYGACITVYNLQGVAVKAGQDSVYVSTLANGVYVAVANGESLKFLVK
ncbi:MAG: hypothetical protein K2M19_06255 [Muribaculaceae bacterium]|nr:hypothetical protein [Muribaculaceae bacterium]